VKTPPANTSQVIIFDNFPALSATFFAHRVAASYPGCAARVIPLSARERLGLHEHAVLVVAADRAVARTLKLHVKSHNGLWRCDLTPTPVEKKAKAKGGAE
jgi:hypothetical protein